MEGKKRGWNYGGEKIERGREGERERERLKELMLV